ncbi:MAG: hypothetical protein MZV70_74460 [Desulfobacterales bacterium]|nr:hypothetical protein [Desulfobacterales bacterium]
MSIGRDAPILEAADDVALADRMKSSRDRMVAELGKVIVGQAAVIEQVMLTLFAGGNSLIVGVPGPGEDAARAHGGATCST